MYTQLYYDFSKPYLLLDMAYKAIFKPRIYIRPHQVLKPL